MITVIYIIINYAQKTWIKLQILCTIDNYLQISMPWLYFAWILEWNKPTHPRQIQQRYYDNDCLILEQIIIGSQKVFKLLDKFVKIIIKAQGAGVCSIPESKQNTVMAYLFANNYQ